MQEAIDATHVFYAAVFGQSPAELNGLGPPYAQARELAAEAAFGSRGDVALW
jgi:hypothetical protein